MRQAKRNLAEYDPVQEFVSGSVERPYSDQVRALPRYVDDAERDFGADLYDRMMRDSCVAAAIDTLRMQVLGDGIHFEPADGSDLAAKARDTVVWAVSGLDLEQVLYDMLLGLAYGSRLAEMVFGAVPGKGYRLERLAVKPRSSYRLLLDPFQRVKGVAGIVPGQQANLPSGYVSDIAALPNVFDPSKFWVLSVQSLNGEPRGSSWLRPAYNAWWMKQQTWPQMLKYLVQFAGPSLIGYTPEHATSVGTRSPEELMLSALKGFQNGSIVVLRGGSKVDKIQSEGEGRAFLEAIDLYNREMTHAILKQTRATLEAKHGSKADSETATDVLDSVVRWIRRMLSASFRHQVVGQIVRLNIGEAPLPLVKLDLDREPSFEVRASAVAKLASSGYLDATQYAGLDAALGLPVRQAQQA